MAKQFEFPPQPGEKDPTRLRGTETWIFDLDNTLYSSSISLFDQIDRRMCAYIARYLNIGQADAYRTQKSYFREHGTTLRGMMLCHGMDPEPYLEYVHEIDIGAVMPEPALAAALGGLSGRKVVFTNSSAAHAVRIMDRLGIAGHFDAVFDIALAGYIPKPDPAVYDKLVGAFGLDARRAVMVEDVARNLAPAAALGMTTVWLAGDTSWARAGAENVKPDFIINDLAGWLAGVSGLPELGLPGG